MPTSATYHASARHRELGSDFYDLVRPAEFPQHILRYRNQRWAERTGLGSLSDEEWIDHFGRFAPLPGSFEQPLALRYHGHQFRTYNPHLGDGRGFLFAQLHDAKDGRLLDLGTKGSGQTPWSRHADGRLTLKGGVREILATEMLEALGVYTSKSFSLFETGESLVRGDEPSPTRSSVLVRLNHSHLRFGTFQRLAHLEDRARLGQLCDFTIATYFPSLTEPAQLFDEICRRSAALCGSWMAAGFVHGVLNTDNMNVTGESFDYGPWRFLPHLDPLFTAAYFDHSKLYAYGRQIEAVRWNLERLAEALSPLVPMAQLSRALVDFEARYLAALSARVLARLGVATRDPITDGLLMFRLFCFLERTRLPFDRFFFDWYGGDAAAPRAQAGPHAAAYAGEGLRDAFAGRAPVRPEAL